MTTKKDVLLAVDGGGTKTQAIVSDLDGNVLGRGLGPSSNMHRVGFDVATKAVQTAIEGALQHLVPAQQRAAQPAWHSVNVPCACFGLAGIDSPADEAEFSQWITKERIATSFRVLNDSELILAAGTPEGWGVALISGTGSVCLGRTKEGKSVRVGGWGHLLGDEGSGYKIALHALQVATQTVDGRADARQLLNAVLRHWSLSDPTDLIRTVYAPTMTQSDIAALAASVSNLSQSGDKTARGILDAAAKDLAIHVDTVIRRLGLKSTPLAVAGGVLRAHFRGIVQEAIESEIASIQYVADPSMGAVTLARRMFQVARHP
jgi:N-acetylglucosamine kinase-like BadF-type ATPase